MWKTITVSLFASVCIWIIFSKAVYAGNVCFECHDKAQFNGKVVHKPVEKLECNTCHNPHVARYKGLLHSREDSLCYSCHKDLENNFFQGIVHDPVLKGNCSVCHASHVSTSKGLLRDNLANECFRCHARLLREYTHTHKPYSQGQCTACHKPHRADNLDLLTDTPEKLCASCHKQADLNNGHQGYPGTLRNCLSCHNPHGSDRDALVRNNLHSPYKKGCGDCHDTPEGTAMANCLSCHENIQEQLLATRSHLTLHDGNSCLNCHSPHAGDTPSLLRSRERLMCQSCHQDTVAQYKNSAFKHPDINSCSACHESHGSRHLSMLKGDGIDVCAFCHKDQGAFTHPVGPDVLEPQTGQMVTCVSCHNPMGTEYKYQLVQEGNKALCNQCHLSY